MMDLRTVRWVPSSRIPEATSGSVPDVYKRQEVEFEFIQLLGLLDTVFLALEFEFYPLLFEHTFTVEIESYTY